jgi:hypothetical protein
VPYESVRFAVGRVVFGQAFDPAQGLVWLPFVQWPSPAEPTLDHT